MTGLHGWLVVDKPVGPTSAQVVGKLKWALRQAGYGKVKIGHGGTLDPLASGVLPIALGEATKLAGFLLNGPKAYAFEICFGRATETDDAEGATVATSDRQPTEGEIRAVLPRFRGVIMQRPPAYSALKVAGQRSHARARAGEEVLLPEREVTVHALALEGLARDSASFLVRCS
ncbi:MAG: tRNA pseudouridine synthase B, partial [Thermaurantiacus sp.]